MSERIRIVLADDHTLFRSGLKALLAIEGDIEVVGEAADAMEAARKCDALKPDVLVLDLAMPGSSGLQMLPRLVKEHPDCRVLVLTMLPEDQYLIQVLKAGAVGYVPKSAADTELIDAIRTVHKGTVYVHPRDVQLLLSDYVKGGQAKPDALELLSTREREVLDLTVRGLSSREIGDRLYISPKTVDTYRQRIMDKLGLEHKSELVAFALKRGLLVE